MIPLCFFNKEKWEILLLLERCLLPLCNLHSNFYLQTINILSFYMNKNQQNCALTHKIQTFMNNHKCLNHVAHGKLAEKQKLSAPISRMGENNQMEHEGKVYAYHVNTPKAVVINHLWTTLTEEFFVFFFFSC